MTDFNGLYPSALTTPGANNALRLTLGDGSWYNLQVKYKNLALLPDIPIQAISDAFKAVRSNAGVFNSFMTGQVLNTANQYYDFCQNLHGHLVSIAAYRDCKNNSLLYRLSATDAMDKVIGDCQAQIDRLASAKINLQSLIDSSAGPQKQVDDLVSDYTLKLAQEDQHILDMKADLSAKWDTVFKDHEVFCDAFSNGIIDATMLIVDIGQATLEVATDETVSPETAKDIADKGVDLIKDAIDLFNAANEAEETLNQIHALYPQLLQAMSLEYQDNRAAVLLDYVQNNYGETANEFVDCLKILTTEQNGWSSIKNAWADWKSGLPADDAEASQYLASSRLDTLSQIWDAFGQVAKNYAAVGNIVYQKVQQPA
jgi:hypothetical protein